MISSIDVFVLIPEGDLMLRIVFCGSGFGQMRVVLVIFSLFGIDGEILVYFASGEEMVGVYLFGCYGDLHFCYFKGVLFLLNFVGG